MLDPKLLRQDIAATAAQLKRRGYSLDVDSINELEAKRKVVQVRTQELQNERNERSRAIGKAKAAGDDIQPLLDEVAGLGDRLKQAEDELSGIQNSLDKILYGIPNIPHPDVPVGADENANIVSQTIGDVPKFDFTPKDHVELGERLGMMHFDAASKISGSRYVCLTGQLAQLQRAITQFMLDVHTRIHDYTEIYVPYIVNAESLRGTGQLPKFEEELFRLNTETPFYLIPTAEVPVTNMVRDRILEEDQLPLKFVAHTPCFRSEAGSHGKDTRGLIRQHQFEKVELVQIVKPDVSYEALTELIHHAAYILYTLELPFQMLELCTGDLGFSSACTYDLEVWLPSQNTYREISSCSNFESFQARRMKARWRNSETGKPEPVHTINGSGLAVGRTLVAIMDNYQDKDGNIIIPEALRAYMGEIDLITA
ncbi:MAG: serine--tRNA ligase [Gammaproteobacteria bacterium]|nr:MAG: serine--tRNA ligase [Gammaproteobacteria bacterium]